MKCGRCCKLIQKGETSGDSSIYQSHGIHLCEPCFFDEQEEIDVKGTNDLPATLKQYRFNLNPF